MTLSILSSTSLAPQSLGSSVASRQEQDSGNSRPQQSSSPSAAPLVNPRIVFDDSARAVLVQIRDQETGEIERQFPSEQVVEQYRRQVSAGERGLGIRPPELAADLLNPANQASQGRSVESEALEEVIFGRPAEDTLPGAETEVTQGAPNTGSQETRPAEAPTVVSAPPPPAPAAQAQTLAPAPAPVASAPVTPGQTTDQLV